MNTMHVPSNMLMEEDNIGCKLHNVTLCVYDELVYSNLVSLSVSWNT